MNNGNIEEMLVVIQSLLMQGINLEDKEEYVKSFGYLKERIQNFRSNKLPLEEINILSKELQGINIMLKLEKGEEFISASSIEFKIEKLEVQEKELIEIVNIPSRDSGKNS